MDNGKNNFYIDQILIEHWKANFDLGKIKLAKISENRQLKVFDGVDGDTSFN